MDCDQLSPNARKIFENIKAYYPPDPWGDPRWEEAGRVYGNGWKDLRKKEDRDTLVNWYKFLIGSIIITSAIENKIRRKKLDRSVFHFKMSKNWIELAVLLEELDFQIETLDLVEG